MSQDRKLKIVWTLKDVTCHSYLIYDYAKVKVSTIADLKIDLVSLFFFFFGFVLAWGVGGSIDGNPIIEINQVFKVYDNTINAIILYQSEVIFAISSIMIYVWLHFGDKINWMYISCPFFFLFLHDSKLIQTVIHSFC